MTTLDDEDIPLREIWGPAWLRICNARDDFRWWAKHLPPLEGDVPAERQQAHSEFVARVQALAEEAISWQEYMHEVQGGWEGPTQGV